MPSSMLELPEVEACHLLLEEHYANKRASGVHVYNDDGERFMCTPGTMIVEHSPFSLPLPSTLWVVDLTEFLTDNFAQGLGCVRNLGGRFISCLDVWQLLDMHCACLLGLKTATGWYRFSFCIPLAYGQCQISHGLRVLTLARRVAYQALLQTHVIVANLYCGA